ISSTERTAGLDYVGDGTMPWASFDSMARLRQAVSNAPNTNYIYQMFGNMKADWGGDYTICTQGGGGSRVWIDEQLLTWRDNVENVGGGEACETLRLRRGEYRIKADGYIRNGGFTEHVSYKYIRNGEFTAHVSYKSRNTRDQQLLIFSEWAPESHTIDFVPKSRCFLIYSESAPESHTIDFVPKSRFTMRAFHANYPLYTILPYFGYFKYDGAN
ncbi:hypothetical protein T484DRAFT_1768741, partial [Baffinella frigidus]